MPQKQIVFDRQELSNLKRAYTMAIKDKKETFIFKGHEFLTAYARYLVEYLESRFNN